MSNKQTAIEWLVEELLNGKALMPSIIEQAKEKEKEQKYKFADEYCEAVMSGCNLRPEQYDNETYGGCKQ